MAEGKDTRRTLRVAVSEDRADPTAPVALHRNLTDFVVGAAIGEAAQILIDHNRYVLEEAQWDRFVTMLDRPARSPEGLSKLFSSRSTFESPRSLTPPESDTIRSRR